MRPARFELATSASAGQTSSWAVVEAAGAIWLYRRVCTPSATQARGLPTRTFQAFGHILDILLPALTTSATKAGFPG